MEYLVDDTFSVTRYNIRLTALMVADKKVRGLPADDIKVLFGEIRRLVPEFNPKVFLFDEARAFFNGFKALFPDYTAFMRIPGRDEQSYGDLPNQEEFFKGRAFQSYTVINEIGLLVKMDSDESYGCMSSVKEMALVFSSDQVMPRARRTL
ncbi:hypothetical protein RB195_011340 [Necator americanus]|uniref:Transposase n=1 Tax=Necator americanus TaxID=51031 RepID=A0ABR1D449_NECAM